MKIQKVSIKDINLNKENPRTISKEKKEKLIKSIKEFPKMLEIRPIVVDDTMTILGGNMRYTACKEAGLKEVYIIKASDLTEEQKKEFIVKDNVGFGDWDWDLLANDWELDKLEEWGLDVGYLSNTEADDFYTKKIEAPKYEPSGVKPEVNVLYDNTKTYNLLEEIDNSDISDDDKQFLRFAAKRHIVFDYGKIADYYAHSDKVVQDLMEKSALVIIDYDKAVEYGYVNITEQIATNYGEE
jgi:hypothetical protein